MGKCPMKTISTRVFFLLKELSQKRIYQIRHYAKRSFKQGTVFREVPLTALIDSMKLSTVEVAAHYKFKLIKAGDKLEIKPKEIFVVLIMFTMLVLSILR